jgi:hypothetical protein
MDEPSSEFEEKVRRAFAAVEPARAFIGCKIASEGDQMFVRVYSQRIDSKRVMPAPYQVFRFDPASGALTTATKEEAARYFISNYK